MWRSRARALLLFLSSIPRSAPPPRPQHPTRSITRVPLPPPRPLSRFLSSSPDPTPGACAAADSFPKPASSPTEATADGASEAGEGEDSLSLESGEAGDARDTSASLGRADAVAHDDEVARVRAAVEAAPDGKVVLTLAGMAVDLSEPVLAAVLLAADKLSCKKLISLFNYATKNNPTAKSLSNLEILVSKVVDADDIDKMDAYLLWDSIKETGSVPKSVSTPLLNGMIAIFLKLGKAKAAVEVFAKFGEFGCTPNGDSYYLLIEAARKKFMFLPACKACVKMMHSGCLPNDGEKVGRILDFLCKRKNAKLAHSLYLVAKEKKIQVPKSAFDSLVAALAQRDGTVATALELLEEYQGESLKHAAESFAAVVHGLCMANKAEDARNLLMRMLMQLEEYQWKSLENAAKTFAAVIRALCRKGKLEDTKTLLMRMVNVDPALGKSVFHLVIKTLSEQGEMEGARGLMGVMESQGVSPDLYTYSVLMSGYAKAGMTAEALALLREAQKFITPTASKLTGER